MSDRFREMEAFVRVAERRSMTLAAQDLELSSSGISKLISALERRHNTRFINRNTRQLSLTSEGGIYFERARAIVNDMKAADSELSNMQGQPRGMMQISLPTGLSNHLMLSAFMTFLEKYPELKVRLLVTDEIVNLIEQRVDLAFRTGDPHTGQLADSSLVARRIGDFEPVICASPHYLKRHGIPKRLEDLLRHKVIASTKSPLTWKLRKAETIEEVTLQPSIVCDNFEMTKALCIAGAGIFRGVRQLLDAHFDEGELVPLFEGYKPVSDRIFYAVMPGRTEGPSRSKDLIGIATEVMRAYRAQRLNLRKAGRR